MAVVIAEVAVVLGELNGRGAVGMGVSVVASVRRLYPAEAGIGDGDTGSSGADG